LAILIKNGYILDPATGTEGKRDILIIDDSIVKVEANINVNQLESEGVLTFKNEENGLQIIEAEGKYVMPGFIDLHVHLREPGYEYKETIASGSRAAARGGYTTICPMPNTNPVIDSIDMIVYLKNKEISDSLVHILPVGAVTVGQAGLELADIKGMAAAGAVGISEDGKSVMNTALYLEGMKEAADVGLIIFAHCEDRQLAGKGVMNEGPKSRELGLAGISNLVEDVITARDILMAKEAGAKLHLCHVSTKDSTNFIKLAKEAGLSVTGEVCPHHFTMSDDEIQKDDGNYKMNPPLRNREDVQALKEGLREGIFDVISTDHAPHGEEEKSKSMKEAPFGIVGSETAFALTMTEMVKTGYLTPMQMVEKMSYNPAKILGIEKGSLAVGKMADIAIADPKECYKIDVNEFASKGKNTPFHGKEVVGRVKYTIVAGEVVFQDK
jgi:dihydroorotase